MSTTAPDALASPTVRDNRTAVTVVSGFDADAAIRVAARLRHVDPEPLLVEYDVSRLGDSIVRCAVVSRDSLIEASTVELDHGCLACAIREDLLPRLVALATHFPDRDLLVLLPPALEPRQLSDAVAACDVDDRPVTESLRIDSLVTVVDPGTLHEALTSDDELSERGLAAAEADRRTVAEVVCRQIEYADTVVTWDDGDAFAAAQAAVTLKCLAPWARRFTVDGPDGLARIAPLLRGRRRHDPLSPDLCERGLEGLRLGVDQPGECGIVSVDFQTRRPFHPRRLHENIAFLAHNTVRGRGHLWLASQPADVVAWESAGSALWMGKTERWLDSLPEEQWNDATSRRRVAATIEWDPYFADRSTHLVFIAVHTDPTEIEAVLNRCLLTDEELAAGSDTWSRLPDPFEELLGTEPE